MDKTGVARVRIVALRGPGGTDAGGGAPDQSVTQGQPELYLQVGAFQQEANAAQLKRKLRGMELERVVVTTARRGGDRLFRVRIGPIPNVARADSLAQRLRRAGLPTGHLVRE